MSLWILDTDHVSLFVEGNSQIRDRAADKFPNVAIAIITVQEIFNGWTGRINDPAQVSTSLALYKALADHRILQKSYDPQLYRNCSNPSSKSII